MNIAYYWSKLFKKAHGAAVKNSRIDRTAKIEAGSQIVNSEIGKYSFCGYDCKILNCTVGAYCSIADDVVIGGAQHPVSWVSTSPVFYAGRDSVKKKFTLFPRSDDLHTKIGNDVWIGEHALIRAGVIIGDGAVIGMGSVVTKDVAPYGIVAGVPAKLIRKRFDDEVCQGLLKSEWWTFDDELLARYASYIKEPKQFLSEISIKTSTNSTNMALKDNGMLKVLHITNMPAPYIVDYLNELGKYCELTGIFENMTATDREKDWFKYETTYFRAIFINALQILPERGLSFKTLPYLSKKYDRIIIANPTTPTGIVSLLYCRWKHVPFVIQSEGGFQGSGKGLKEKFKKYIMEKADFYLTGMGGDNDYFLRYGATSDKLRPYPFTSLHEADIEQATISASTKKDLKTALGMDENVIIVSVGRIVPSKGFDVLLNAYAKTDKTAGLYIIGGKPTPEHSKIISENELDHVHFIDFVPPDRVKDYYLASDIFVLPTKRDTWGLVINEAMANGLPVITTDMCVAGLEMIKNGVNGFIVPTGNVEALQVALEALLDNEELRGTMAIQNLIKIKKYSFENMAKVIFEYIDGNIDTVRN